MERIAVILILIGWGGCSQAQISTSYLIAFYNVENLFDIRKDSVCDDNEFLPSSVRRWTPKRYQTKLRNLSKVIATMGGAEIPAIVGLCEIENDSVMRDLTTRAPLRALRYRYLLATTSDVRGVRTALLYQPTKFKPIASANYSLRLSRKTPQQKTRHLFHVSGLIVSGDTLDLFVCHFPSRSGGVAATKRNRIEAANQLKRLVDSVMMSRRIPNMVVMGDFNDTSTDKSIIDLIADSSKLSSLDYQALFNDVEASYKYREEWFEFDRIMVSPALRASQNPIRLSSPQCFIYAPDYLLEDDPIYYGKRPFRTYYGMKYHGGFSDHLPIFVRMECRITER